jgi:gluconate 2-dehydrogenase gamma chain
MDKKTFSRRRFLAGSGSGISAAWLAAHWPELLAAQEHAHRAAASDSPLPFQVLTSEQAAEVEAMTAQIIPTDSTSGAREAGVVYFIDRALATFDRDKRKLYLNGLNHLQSQAKKKFPKTVKFSTLAAPEQIEVLKTIEKSEFFELVRFHTIAGFFANPEYGGNRNRAGWRAIGFDDAAAFQPPFGFYDRNYKE